MSYTANTPQSGNSLNYTLPIINANFGQIFDVNGVNHVDFDLADKGKHKFLQMPKQSAGPATAANEGGLYTKLGVAPQPVETNLFFRAEGTGKEYQMTSVSSGDTATFGTNTSYVADHTGGWTFLPGGLILQYGVRTSMIQGSNTITFPYTFPTAVFSLQITPVRNSNNVDTVYVQGTINLADFVARNTSNGGISSAHWYAIGN